MQKRKSAGSLWKEEHRRAIDVAAYLVNDGDCVSFGDGIQEDELKPSAAQVTQCDSPARLFCPFVAIVTIFLYAVVGIIVNLSLAAPNRRVIMMYGDSLVHKPMSLHHLHRHIQNDLYYLKPTFILEVGGRGFQAHRISDLRNNLERQLLHRMEYSTLFTWELANPPDAVILHWDSDVNPGPRDGSSPMDPSTLADYLDVLHDVLGQLKRNVGTVIMAGPSLSGELPRGKNALDGVLDHYVQLNGLAAAKFNITYVDTRSLYFAHLPRTWNQSSGYLTFDGEHPNKRGSMLLCTAFRDALLAENGLW